MLYSFLVILGLGAFFYFLPLEMGLWTTKTEGAKVLHFQLGALGGVWRGVYGVELAKNEDVPAWDAHLSTILLPKELERRLGEAIDDIGAYERFLQALAPRTRCRRLGLRIGLGIDRNPALTGIAVGLVQAAGGACFPKIRQRLKCAPGEPRLQVAPLFRENEVDISLDCILTFRCGDIMRGLYYGLAGGKGAMESGRIGDRESG